MQTAAPLHDPARAATALHYGAVLRRPEPGAQGGCRDAQFIDLLNAYRRSGGLARATDVIAMLRQHGAVDVAAVTRWIARREVVHFDWQGDTWMPLFQMGPADMQPRPMVGRVLAELSAVLVPWAVAQWFARPNVELAHSSPADAMATDPMAVWQAARADRWLVDA